MYVHFEILLRFLFELGIDCEVDCCGAMVPTWWHKRVLCFVFLAFAVVLEPAATEDVGWLTSAHILSHTWIHICRCI